MAGSERFYAVIEVTVYANSQEEADTIAEQAANVIRSNTDRDDVGDVMVEDVEADPQNGED